MRVPLFLIPSLVLTTFAFGQSTRPTLDHLQRETQDLYRQVQASIVHVHVPVQVLARITGQEHPLQKWAPQLSQEVIRQLDQNRIDGPTRIYLERPIPSTNTATQPVQIGGPPAQGPMLITPVVFGDFVGIVLDQEGHVLLPLFIDKSIIGPDIQLRVTYDDREATSATLLGGDRPTNLAVIKLNQPLGTPVRMSNELPAMGSMVLLIAPVRRTTRLTLWSGGQDDHGIVINSTGELTGFMRYGHMLEPKAFRTVVDELKTTGTVRRATLGLKIRELPPDDAVRMASRVLGDRPVAQVVEVDPAKPAAAAGVLPGDLILTLAGEPVNDLAHFATALVDRSGPTELRILRNGVEQTLTVDLEPK